MSESSVVKVTRHRARLRSEGLRLVTLLMIAAHADGHAGRIEMEVRRVAANWETGRTMDWLKSVQFWPGP